MHENLYLMGVSAILSVGTALPPSRYPQTFLSKFFTDSSPKFRRFFEHPHIQSRHLVLPPFVAGTDSSFEEESTGALLQKFKKTALQIGAEAIDKALNAGGCDRREVDYLCCVTSTGLLVPGLTALYFEKLGFRQNFQRADLVGMGCNGGLNGLNATTTWSQSNPGRLALLVCVEICSAIYDLAKTERNAIVNSLFGDGAAAALISSQKSTRARARLNILGFSSWVIANTLSYLRFDWEDSRHRHSFYIDKETPKHLAAEVEIPISNLLQQHSLHQSQIKHWIVHSGGAAILDGIQSRLNLETDAFRYTRSVLSDYGNISSGSFLFSLERLLTDRRAEVGDFGVLMTMGPGLTIETALVQWAE